MRQDALEDVRKAENGSSPGRSVRGSIVGGNRQGVNPLKRIVCPLERNFLGKLESPMT